MFATLIAAALALPAQTCHQPTTGFGAYGVAFGPNGGTVKALEVYDDGQGPALYVGGSFTIAGEAFARAIARFDGVSWQTLPASGDAEVIDHFKTGVIDMEVFDDGSGPALYVAASFDSSLGLPPHGIARWNGTSWASVLAVTSQFAGYPEVRDMLVWDDGTGPALYFCGLFNQVDGQPAASIAKYTSSGWSPLGAGYTGSFASALAVYDDGGGEQLFVGGLNFPTKQDVQVWNGSTWSFDPTVFDQPPSVLYVHDDGGGLELYAGGAFTTPASQIAKWNGSAWSALAGGTTFAPHSLATFDDGSGSKLYAVGGFAGHVDAMRWTGSAWETLGTGFGAAANVALPFDDGPGPALYVGGDFMLAGGKRADHIARWTSTGWSRIYSSKSLIGPSNAFCSFDDGGGEKLYSTGGIVYVQEPNDYYHDSVVYWTGSAWTALPGIASGVLVSLASFDAGSGASLYAGGGIDGIGGTAVNGIARWDGSQWNALGSGLTLGGSQGDATSMVVHDFGAGPRLVVAGRFDTAGGVAADDIAMWDGASWTAFASGVDGTIHALAVFDDGTTGPLLYAGGDFVTANGVTVNHVARWQGTAWAPVAGGMNREVYSLATLDLGAGPSLYAGGDFFIAGSVMAERVARFDGASWQALHQNGFGLNNDVVALATYDEGRGPELIVGGTFTSAGGQLIRSIARWDGATWSGFSDEPNGPVRALHSFDDATGSGPALFAGGDFDSWGDTVSMCVARWAPSCPCAPVVYCTAKINSLGCTPAMYVTGSTSLAVNNLRLHAANVLNNKNGLMFWSYKPNGAPFQGGFLCAKPPIVRTPVQSSAGNPPPNDCSGSLHFHWNQAYVAAEGLTVGDWYYCQYWSRDPQDPATTSLSDALRFLLCP